MRKIIVTVCVVVVALLVAGSQRASSQQTSKTFVAFSLKAAQAKIAQCVKEGVDFRRKYPEVHQLGYITRPVGLVVDKENDDVVIVGERHQLPPIYLDDLVVALRSIFVAGEDHPGVSIDPVGDEKNPRTQVVRFMGPLQDTRFGRVCFEADYLLKKISLNEELLRTKEVRTFFDLSVEELSKKVKTFFDLSVEELRQSEGARKWVYSRFWFMPAADCHKVVGDVVILRPIDLQVFTEIMGAEMDGKRVKDVKNIYDYPSKESARLFTNAYDEVAKEKVVLEELRQMGRLVSLVKGLKKIQGQVRLDYWLIEFGLANVKTPKEVPILRKEYREKGEILGGTAEVGFSMAGGVRLGSVVLNVKGDTAKLIKASLAARPSQTVLTWPFDLTGEWDVIALPGGADPKTLGELFAQAFFLEEQKRHDAAIEAYSRAIQLNPSFAETYNNRGLVYAKGKLDYDRAIADFDRALSLNLNFDKAYNNRGIAYMGKKQFDRAIPDYNKAIELNPNFAQAYTNRGLAYSEKGSYDQAIADHDKAIKLNPNFAEAYSNRGCVYTEGKKQYDRAISDFNKAIALSPGYAIAYSNRGVAYYRKKEYDYAISDQNNAIGLDSNYAQAYTNRGVAYSSKGLYNLAIADHDKAIELDPNFAMAYYNRGAAYADGKKQFDRAIADYDKAIALDGNCVKAYINRGNAYSHKQLYDRAIADYNKAIVLDPNDAVTYFNRGTTYYHKREYDRAITDYDKAISLNLNFAEAYLNRGFAYAEVKGDYDRAIADYDKAIALNSNIAEAYFYRGSVYFEIKGDYNRAIADYNRAIELNPKSTEAYANRGGASLAKQDYDLAISDLNMAITLNPNNGIAYSNRAVAWFFKKDYDKAWTDVERARQAGYMPPPGFIEALRRASGRQE